ncbi:MAG TPA: DUF3465 domain-containing protein [Pyrinomonadaceae bacterium]|nr:DUF3465 domain-containing protein [Pyrinomonadaceae bacterium]
MKQLIKFILVSLLLCLIPADSIAQKSGRKPRRPSPVICKLAAVPKGMVVVGYKRNSACSDGTELLVKRPENGDIICAESPVPPQFTITTEAQGSLVGTCRNKAFLITRSGAGAGAASDVDDSIGRAFANRSSDIQVEGEGTVTRILADDLDGSRHQRFIVQLASGLTVLITHNIDVAPRIDALEVGDSVRFSGEYVWNEKGGLIHWTHHDPRGRHVSGWVVHKEKTYK